MNSLFSGLAAAARGSKSGLRHTPYEGAVDFLARPMAADGRATKMRLRDSVRVPD